jgi:hypothetical protein
MDKKILNELKKEEVSEFHQTFLRDTRALVDMSRRKMSTFYEQWDHNIDVFQGLIRTDKEDVQARERKEPEKMVVPIAYSQVMTFVAFCFSLYTQRERVFELLGMSEEDHKPAKIGESFLARDLAMNLFEQKLFQFLLDVARCSIGVFKISWSHERQVLETEVTKPILSVFGIDLGSNTVIEKREVTKFLGNRLTNISPYRFFPDTRLPLSRFQEGEFVASEDEYSYTTLKQLEHEGLVTGIDYIKNFTEKDWEARGKSRTSDNLVFPNRSGGTGSPHSGQSRGTIIVTEVQRSIVPSKYMIEGKPLGPEDYPIKYLIWYANDQRIIRLEPLGYLHNEFTYTLAEFTPDQHNLINMSLSDTIDSLQSVISWFINSHITSVRKVISNYLIVDPNGIEMNDLKERKPVIRLKANAAGGIDRFVKQLSVNDVTARHLEDVDVLQRIVQLVTGISENLMGQFHPGRRSATEARNVNSGAIGRLKMLATIIYKSGLEPLAKQMLSNLRDGLDEPTMVRLVGLEDTVTNGPLFANLDKSALVGNYDFEIFDGTLPSEKAFTAQALQDFLSGFIQNPQAAIALQLDPREMVMDAMELRGIRNPERYKLKPMLPGNVAPLNEQSQSLSGQDVEGGPAPGLSSSGPESILSLFGQGNPS